MSDALTVPTDSKTLVTGRIDQISTYAETAATIAPAFDRMETDGVTYVMTKLNIGYHLALIRQTRGALARFILLASKGLPGIRRMSKWQLETSLAMFDQFLKDQGWNKKAVPELEEAHKLHSVELALWTQPQPETANEMISIMQAWAKAKGLKQVDDEILAPEGDQPETPLLSGHQSPGADMTPEAVRQRLIDTQAERFEEFQQWLTTDAFFATDENGKRLSLEEVTEKGVPQTWSVLPDEGLDAKLQTLDKAIAAIKYVQWLRQGGTSARTRKPTTAKGGSAV